MTTRIKLRRDTAANWATNNPILALGEPGLETDTRKIKYGDGITHWSSLPYAAGGGNASGARWVAAINTCGNGQLTSTSINGRDWTGATPNGTSGNNSWISELAVGNNAVVYLVNTYGPSYIGWSRTPYENIRDIKPVELTESPDLVHVDWSGVTYQGGYFIAYGNISVNAITSPPSTIYTPIWIYSQDGEHWTRGNVTNADIESIVDTEYTAGNSGVGGLNLNAVTYNGTGWLFNTTWSYGGSANQQTYPGGFYITSITGTLNTASYSNTIPGAGLAVWTGSRWAIALWDWEGTDEDILWTNTSTNPKTGSWTSHNMSTAANGQFGTPSGSYYRSIEGLAHGTVAGTDYLVVNMSSGQTLVSANGGSTWSGILPIPVHTRITGKGSGTGTNYITLDNSDVRYTGEKFTIAGSSVSAMNGTFYFGTLKTGSQYHIWADAGLTTPVDTTSWSTAGVTVSTNHNYGSNTFTVNGDASGLRVGMIGGSGIGNNPYPTITAINGNTVTIDQPFWYEAIDDSETFYPCLTYGHGWYNYDVVYGGEQFMCINSLESPGNFIAVSKGDPTVQANWTWINAYPHGFTFYYWFNRLSYGIVSSPDSAWTYTVEDDVGVVNQMILSNDFSVSVTDGNYGSGVNLLMDPGNAAWYLGAHSNNNDLGTISSYDDNAVQLSINDNYLSLNYNGTVTFPFFTFPAAHGTANQVLKDDGSGNLTWSDVEHIASIAPNARTGTANTLVLTTDNTNQVAITGPAPDISYPAAPRLVIAGRDGYGTGEGGDIYLWAGRGYDGGDIKVDAGNGTGAGQTGGTIKIRAGNNTNTNGVGGYVAIEAGAGGDGGSHGDVVIRTGPSTVNHWTFGANGDLSVAGNITRAGGLSAVFKAGGNALAMGVGGTVPVTHFTIRTVNNNDGTYALTFASATPTAYSWSGFGMDMTTGIPINVWGAKFTATQAQDYTIATFETVGDTFQVILTDYTAGIYRITAVLVSTTGSSISIEQIT
jgi:Major tropism determinant N-terminal domain